MSSGARAVLLIVLALAAGGLVLLFASDSADDESLNVANLNETQSAFTITSASFADGEFLPATHTCDGGETSPPITIARAPEGTAAFALIATDPDIPQQFKDARGIDDFVHWVLYDIPADTEVLPESTVIGVRGVNSAGGLGFVGACPPSNLEPTEHRYIFTLYALEAELGLQEGADRDEVIKAMEGKILGTATIAGLYDRSGRAEETGEN